MNLQRGNIRPATYQLVPLTKTLVNNVGSVLIADGVGVGKTISAGYIILYLSQYLNRPAAVVVSPTLISKWIEELRSKFGIPTFAVRSVEEMETARGEEAVRRAGVTPPAYIVSSSLIGKVKAEKYPVLSAIVFDEIHNYRNQATAAHSSALALARNAPYRIGLSATPINNSVDDLASELRILLAEESWEAVAETVRELWASSKATIANPLVTRFTKNKLGQTFAKRRITTRTVGYPETYAKRVQALIRVLRQKRAKWSALDGITYYRLATSSHIAFERALRINEKLLELDPKLGVLREVLRQEDISHWLVFCEFEETVHYLEDEIADRPVFTLTGNTPMFDRDSIIRAFRNSESAVLIMTPVGTEGIDLQFCSGVVNYDLHWNPMRLEQRVGRIDRVGQQKPVIDIVNIVVSGSIDERVLSIIKRKLELIQKSVFAVGTLFDWNVKTREKTSSFVDDETLRHELNEGSRLVETLRQNESIPEKDYFVLDSIEVAYCDAGTLRSAAAGGRPNPKWIGEDKVTSSWLKDISEGGAEFLKLVKYYR